jgi:membrane protease YdiL (CAAX protease family)
MLNILDLRSVIHSNEMKPSAILILSVVLLSIHRNFGSMQFAHSTFAPGTGLMAPLFMFATAFILLGLLPLTLIVSVFREDPRKYGLCIGDWRAGMQTTGLLFPLIAIGLLYPASHTAEMRDFYPFARGAGDSVLNFLLLEVPRGILFYTAWEFFFRGFMLFGLRPYVGDWLAICIQTIPSCLWHIGMPTGELLSSIAGGVLFGIMALRTGSILWPLSLHYLIGIGLDIFIVVRF